MCSSKLCSVNFCSCTKFYEALQIRFHQVLFTKTKFVTRQNQIRFVPTIQCQIMSVIAHAKMQILQLQTLVPSTVREWQVTWHHNLCPALNNLFLHFEHGGKDFVVERKLRYNRFFNSLMSSLTYSLTPFESYFIAKLENSNSKLPLTLDNEYTALSTIFQIRLYFNG